MDTFSYEDGLFSHEKYGGGRDRVNYNGDIVVVRCTCVLYT